MTTTALPDIDTETREELSPPCEVTTHITRKRCTRKADDIVTLSCTICGYQWFNKLFCRQHTKNVMNYLWWCTECKAARTIIIESLTALR